MKLSAVYISAVLSLIIMSALIRPSAGQQPTATATGCELDVLTGLGQQAAYNSAGYTLDLTWHPVFNAQWQSLGCLQSLQELRLSGSLPNLPAAWAQNSSFPRLQVLDLALSSLSGTLPPEWGQTPQAFPQLRIFNASQTQLSGPLPSAWGTAGAFPRLSNLTLVNTRINGTLPDSWAGTGIWPALLALQIDQTDISGSLPDSWGQPGAFAALVNLEILETKLSGALPSAWGAVGAFPTLQYMGMAGNAFTGTLPDTWAASGSFRDLSLLDLSGTSVRGSIPASWGTADAFPSLLFLYLNRTQLSGGLPAFNNSRLSLLIASNSAFGGNLDSFWGSSAPLLASLLAGNNISGNLPGNSSGLPHLAFLDVSSNSVQGQVPVSWLNQNQILSHIIGLNVGQAWWDATHPGSNFIQDLCLQPQLYKANVQSQPLSRVMDILGEIFATPGFQGAVGDRYAATTDTFVDFYTQLSSVKSICSNHDAPKILLIMWLTFAGATIVLVVVYETFRIRARMRAAKAAAAQQAKQGSSWQIPNSLRSASRGARVIKEGFWSLAELVLYYYDLLSAAVVLSQVWGAWPGFILLAIFLVHFALTGSIVLYHGLKVHYDRWQAPNRYDCRFVGMILGSLALSPFMIPVVWLLDMIVLYVELRHFVVQHLAKLCMRQHKPRPFVRKFSSIGKDWFMLSTLRLGWLDLEYFEDMHTLGAAFYQTVPTIVLNSIIFRLGNKPSHGEFFDKGLFVSCMIAAYLSLFKTFITITWHAYHKGSHAFEYALDVLLGRYLIRYQHAGGSSAVNTSLGSLQLNPMSSTNSIGIPGATRSSSTQLMLPQGYIDVGSSSNPSSLLSMSREPSIGLGGHGQVYHDRHMQQSQSIDSNGEETIRWV